MRKFFIPCYRANNIVLFNLNLSKKVSRGCTPNSYPLCYLLYTKLVEHCKCTISNQVTNMVQHITTLGQLQRQILNMSRPINLSSNHIPRYFTELLFVISFLLMRSENVELTGTCGCLLKSKYVVLE